LANRYRGTIFPLSVIACCLFFTTLELTGGTKFLFTFDLASPAPASARLFYDIGNGFNENDSQISAVKPQPAGSFERFEFELPRAPISEIRLDLQLSSYAARPQNVAIRSRRGYFLPISTAPSPSAGSSFDWKPREPFRYMRARTVERIPAILRGNAVLLGVSFLVFLVRMPLNQLWILLVARVRRANSRLRALARTLSVDGFIQFDLASIWFYFACLTVFGLAFLANLNGSSTGFYRQLGYAPQQAPLLGVARSIRSDEWWYHTPDILNQVLRRDRFAVERTSLGGQAISLAGNIPVRHISTLFRPQFWGFLFLPVEYAFSAYWQFKGLVLITGVFTWLLLLTRSSLVAATGALWYFFSPFTQWTYSWPSLLPEMVGLLCLTLVFVCYLTVGRSGVGLLIAALGASSCLINFILCGYPPHLIPLGWLAVFFLAGWCIAFRKSILQRQALGRRLLAVLGSVTVLTVTGIIVYTDLRPAIETEVATVYPGQRTQGGGYNLSIPLLLSHFMPWSEKEYHFPAAGGDICEAAGFLWFAPIAWLLWSRRTYPPAQQVILVVLSVFFLLIAIWMVAPVPKEIGKLFALDRTFSTRCLPALGLANIAIVALFLAQSQKSESSRATWRGWVLRAAATFTLFSGILFATNASIHSFFSVREVAISACVGTPLILLLIYRHRRLFAIVLIAPLVVMFGDINPIERGLGVIISSDLAVFVHSHPELLGGKWLVYSDSSAPSGFLTATGCDVYTYASTTYLPDVDHFPLFEAQGLDLNIANRGGYHTAHLIDAGAHSRFELIEPGRVRWYVSVSEPTLRKLNIRYFAFDRRPPPEIAAYLIPLSAEPVSTLWLYRAF
jgi:hypothetical protein